MTDRYDSALLDLDGVLYIGGDAVPGAPEAVAAARAAGMRVAFVTNNASRTPDTVADHLTSLGVPATPADVVTSAQAAATLVAEVVPPGAAVLVVGGEGLDVALAERGLRPVRRAADNPQAVVQGFAPDVGWRLLAEGAYAVRAGLPWIASNLDVTVPTADGFAPGNGALVEVIAAATGRRPVSAGKPEIPLHREAVRRTGALRPLVVGDRLDTDVEGANRAGVASLLVLTGVTTAVDLVLAEPAHRPTYVSADLWSGLVGEHPPVRRHPDGGWTCGGWVCTVVPSGIALVGTGEPLDGLRAACVACWQPDDVDRPDDGVVREVVAGLGL
ncbi:HAD-IIA family hydrolase [Blastococcus sp. CT_GayMR19]|nr:HAD-IIA family hydrolase [Blastococcus sp. CT_GayMR19]